MQRYIYACTNACRVSVVSLAELILTLPDMSKRGPKPSEVAKVVYYRRVPAEWVDRLDAFISTNGAVRDVGYMKTPTEASKGLESKGMGVVGGAENEDLVLAEENRSLKAQLEAMTISYEEEFRKAENYMIDVGNLNDELSKVAGWSDDEKVVYWRNRAILAETQLKGKTNEYDQG